MKSFQPLTVFAALFLMVLLVIPAFLLDLSEDDTPNRLNRPSMHPAQYRVPEPATNKPRAKKARPPRDDENADQPDNGPPDDGPLATD